jgi:hypothetical protein
MAETPGAPPMNATEARTRLDTLTADKAWGERVMSGDVAAKKELAAKRVAAAMTVIEHEWELAQRSGDKRMIIEIGRTIR